MFRFFGLIAISLIFLRCKTEDSESLSGFKIPNPIQNNIVKNRIVSSHVVWKGDTISDRFFDRRGNLTRSSTRGVFGSTSEFYYDSNNFLIRQVLQTDYHNEEIVFYEIYNEHLVLQLWDTGFKKDTVFLHFDDVGRLSLETGTSHGIGPNIEYRIDYLYDRQGKLKTKRKTWQTIHPLSFVKREVTYNIYRNDLLQFEHHLLLDKDLNVLSKEVTRFDSNGFPSNVLAILQDTILLDVVNKVVFND